MTLLRSLLFAFLFYALTTLMVFPGLVVALASRRGMSNYARAWGRAYLWLARGVLGVRLRVEGTVPASPALVAAKHESAYETLALLAMIGSSISASSAKVS